MLIGGKMASKALQTHVKNVRKKVFSRTNAFESLFQAILVDIPMNASVVSPGSEMANVYNNSVARFWNNVFYEVADPRTRDWFLMSSPVPGAGIMFGYLYFVLSWGPRHMEHRKPYKLKNTLILYNLVQVILSVWLFWEGLDAAWLRKYSWKCEPVDYSNSPEALRVARGVYMYFLAKISELLDTVFFVLRKKEQQITFLHMYHHTVMPLISWGATKYYPGGHGTFIGVINSFVHIVMYTYYLLAAALPQYQRYFWWKKYITTLQMGQFCLAFIHSLQLLVYDCDYPRWSLILILPNVMFFYFLFSDFYNKAYVPEQEKLAMEQAKKDGKLKGAKENGAVKENGTAKKNGTLKENGVVKRNGAVKANGTVKENGAIKANGTVKENDSFKENGSVNANGFPKNGTVIENGAIKANGFSKNGSAKGNGALKENGAIEENGDAEEARKMTNGNVQNGKVKKA